MHATQRELTSVSTLVDNKNTTLHQAEWEKMSLVCKSEDMTDDLVRLYRKYWELFHKEEEIQIALMKSGRTKTYSVQVRTTPQRNRWLLERHWQHIRRKSLSIHSPVQIWMRWLIAAGDSAHARYNTIDHS